VINLDKRLWSCKKKEVMVVRMDEQVNFRESHNRKGECDRQVGLEGPDAPLQETIQDGSRINNEWTI
jgi:hypothetical protein